MSKEFSPQEDDQMPEKKSSQQRLLLLLLMLIAVFAYLYFFTNMIRPHETQPRPQPSPQVMVKKPLPPRLEQKGARPETPEAKPAKPEAAAAKPHGKPKALAAAAPQAKIAKPGASAANEAKSVAAAEQKPAANTAAEAKTAAEKGAGEGTAPQKKPKVAAKRYVLEIREDLAESEMAPVMAKLKQAGVGHVVKRQTQKVEPMHRLFLADFANRDEALEELGRLKLVSSDAFMLNENCRYMVYAGSYLRERKAAVEQNRLLAKGVRLLIRSATAQVAVVKVRAGSFADQASAEKAAKSLKKEGLWAKVVKIGC